MTGLVWLAPGGVPDDAAEVAADELGVLVGEDVGLDVAERGLGLLVDAVVEGLDDVFLEVGGAWVLGDDGVADLVGVEVVSEAEDVHLDAGGDQGDDRMHVLRDTGGSVQGDAGPDVVDVLLRDTALLEELGGGVGAVHFEAVLRAGVAGHQADVVEHGTGVEQLRVVVETALLTGKGGEVVDAAGVVVEQLGLGVADELLDLAGELGVGDGDAGNGGGHV